MRAMTDTSNDDTTGGVPATAGNDAENTAKDRSYSPSSERETAERQASGTGAEIDGVEQLPGTGGPDDSGDTTVPDDDIDPATIVARSHLDEGEPGRGR